MNAYEIKLANRIAEERGMIVEDLRTLLRQSADLILVDYNICTHQTTNKRFHVAEVRFGSISMDDALNIYQAFAGAWGPENIAHWVIDGGLSMDVTIWADKIAL